MTEQQCVDAMRAAFEDDETTLFDQLFDLYLTLPPSSADQLRSLHQSLTPLEPLEYAV